MNTEQTKSVLDDIVAWMREEAAEDFYCDLVRRRRAWVTVQETTLEAVIKQNGTVVEVHTFKLSEPQVTDDLLSAIWRKIEADLATPFPIDT